MKYTIPIITLFFMATSCLSYRIKKERLTAHFQVAVEDSSGNDVLNNTSLTLKNQLLYNENVIYEAKSDEFPIFEVLQKKYIIITPFLTKNIDGRSDIYMFLKDHIYVVNSETGKMYEANLSFARMLKLNENKHEILAYDFKEKEKVIIDLILVENK